MNQQLYLSNLFLKKEKPDTKATRWTGRLKESLRELRALINRKLWAGNP